MDGKMYGWNGKILLVDLNEGKTRILRPDRPLYERYIGGKGLGGYFLRSCATLDWHDPGMVVCILTGPLTGTTAPTSGRAHIFSKSPLTGLIAEASVGGKLGTRLKNAGFDGIVITGKSPKPVGIIIDNQDVRLADASALWGLDTIEIHQKINPQKASLACIGPAAENGVRFSAIIVDKHFAAGRTGLGLCLAQKNIKYLLVNGSGRCRVHDPKKLKSARTDIFRLTAASPALMGEFGFAALGTGAVYDLMDNRRMMPTDNFRKTHHENAAGLNAAAYQKKYRPDNHGCLGCHMLCKKIARNGSRDLAIPEFETMSHFTALIGCRDTDLVMKANALCNRRGMDTISAASVLACHREILRINYTPDQVLGLLADIAAAKGPGKNLLLGTARYAEKMGSPESAMAVKGLELPAYDPRGAYGMALGYAVSTRGGCHLRAYPISHEIFRKPVATDRFSFSGKARIIKIAEDMNAVVDSLTACKFIFFAAGLEEYAAAFEAVTGIETSAQDLMEKGERICYNERIINALNGCSAEDDCLPDRFFTQPGSGGNQIDVPPINRTDFLETRQKYYRIRGLDPDGMPTQKKADRLGLEWKIL